MKIALTSLLFLALTAGCVMEEGPPTEAGAPVSEGNCRPRKLPQNDGVVLEEKTTKPAKAPATPPKALFAPGSGELIFDPVSGLPHGHLLHLEDRESL